MGLPVLYPKEGGIGPQDVRPFLPVCGPISTFIWNGDVGSDPMHWTSPQ